MDLVKQTLFLDKETFPELDKIASAQGASRSFVIRWAIQEYLNRMTNRLSLPDSSINSIADHTQQPEPVNA